MSGSYGVCATTQSITGCVACRRLKAIGESVARPLLYYRNNLDTTLSLLEVMVAHGCKRFIFSSSATVYGMANKVPFTEDMPVGGCTNPYGWTKFMIEQVLRDAAAADAEMSAVLLRYFNPIGAHESGLIGEQPQGISNNLMPYLCLVAAGKLPQLRVFGADYPTPDGTEVRDYIHVVDLARGHAAALAYAASHRGAEAVNLGTGRGSSVLDLIRSFERVNGIKIPYAIAPRRRHRRMLGRRGQGRASAGLEGRENARRHVPRFVELDEEVAVVQLSKEFVDTIS